MSTTTTMTITQESSGYNKGEHYTELNNPIKELPPVVVFFSFLDRASKDWATKHEIVQTIRRHVPVGTEVSRYHSSEPWQKDLGEDLNHAWAVAKSLQIDDRVIGPLFEAIHGDAKLIDIQGVKAVFHQNGMPEMRFDNEYAKLSVKEEAKWMDEARQRLNIKQIPAVVVSGRYLIKPEAFGSDFNADKVADVVKELLRLK